MYRLLPSAGNQIANVHSWNRVTETAEVTCLICLHCQSTCRANQLWYPPRDPRTSRSHVMPGTDAQARPSRPWALLRGTGTVAQDVPEDCLLDPRSRGMRIDWAKRRPSDEAEARIPDPLEIRAAIGARDGWDGT
jgi:hypothetical protein